MALSGTELVIDGGDAAPLLPVRASTAPAGRRRPCNPAAGETSPDFGESEDLGCSLGESQPDFASTWPASKGPLFRGFPATGRCVDEAFRENLKIENQTLRAENSALREAVEKAREGVRQRLDRSGSKEHATRQALEKVLPKKTRQMPGGALDSPRGAADTEGSLSPNKATAVDLIAPSWREQAPPMSRRARTALKAVAADIDFASTTEDHFPSCPPGGELVAPG